MFLHFLVVCWCENVCEIEFLHHTLLYTLTRETMGCILHSLKEKNIFFLTIDYLSYATFSYQRINIASFRLQPLIQDPVKNRNSCFVTWTSTICVAHPSFISLSQSLLLLMACLSSIFWRGIGTCSRAPLISKSTWLVTRTPCTPWRVTSINW